MRKILVMGAGKIGHKIVQLLNESEDYEITVADKFQPPLDSIKRASNGCTGPRVQTRLVNPFTTDLKEAIKGQDAVISALYHDANVAVAEAALFEGCSYFDLTEDVRSTEEILDMTKDGDMIANGHVFMPQCGLAPGFVSIVAGNLAALFDKVDTIHLRVGALPQFPEGKLKYNLTWSTDGLINEYCNPCNAIVEHEYIQVPPLESVEHFSIDGTPYEAFNTSGGLGTLYETVGRHCRELNYKTLRYPGHRDLMHFLLHDLRFVDRRDDLKKLLEATLPASGQDVVVIFCTATGWVDDKYVKFCDVRRIYSDPGKPARNRCPWSAIQITTAASVCAIVDMHFEGILFGNGLVRQENVDLNDFLNNRFGKAYANLQRCDAGVAV